MKFIALIIILGSHFISIGQLDYKTDTNCYSFQHIAVGSDHINLSLFKSKDSTSLDFYDAVRYLNRARKLKIKGYDESYLLNVRKSNPTWLFNYHGFPREDAFINYTWHPLTDEYGDPITRKLEDGTEVFVYPPDDTLAFTYMDVWELRIEEQRNFLTNEFEINTIGFVVMDDYEQVVEIFRVDYEEMNNAIKNMGWSEEKTPWLRLLQTKSYAGFRYKMGRCDELFER